MKIQLSRFIKDIENGPQNCLSCDDEDNGINYGQIWIGDFELKINLCNKCLKKLKRIIK